MAKKKPPMKPDMPDTKGDKNLPPWLKKKPKGK